MELRGGRFLAASLVIAAGFGMVAFAGCGGDDGENTYNSGTGGTAGTGGTGMGGTGATGATGGTGGGLCGPGTTECSGTCVDIKNDPANCGACGNACPAGELCSNGTCGLFCSGGTVNCNGKCVNTTTDPANCGACGTACAEGEVCFQGSCASTCGAGTENCGGTCVDTNNDPDNCGACGTKCPDGQVCSGGTCSMSCGGGTTQCGNACVDTNLDPANCGACGTACKTGEVCSVGVCTVNCAGGTTQCGNLCVDTETDPKNCGACSVVCTAGQVCSNGTCGVSCGGGTTQCGTACVDTKIDPNNCGACGVACPAGQVCSNSVCGLVCTGGTTACSGICVDTKNDPANCGGCANLCPTGQVCSNSVCGLTCGTGTLLCSGTCVDTKIDPNNCGTCGNVCGANLACVDGVCSSSCATGLTFCNGFCVSLQNDDFNCGACGTVCTPGQDCTAGTCVECDSSTTDCDGDGWLVSEGDCCDKPGPCGSEPEKVNPGAIEVLGNGIDDNCNGLTDLFDLQDTAFCDDTGLATNSTNAVDYAKALGICRTTTENPPLAQRTWGLIEAKLVRADGSAVVDNRAHSIRGNFGAASPIPLEGQRVVVLSTGIAADGSQTTPGPNGGPGTNPATAQNGAGVNISTCTDPLCIKDWYATPNPPLKPANGLPDSPDCSTSLAAPQIANDSIMLVLRMRAPTNARAFSFNSYFYSAEYPEFVCSDYNDQFIALVNTPSGTPTPIANPVDKNLMTYTKDAKKWPIGINIAKGTSLFSVCEPESVSSCWSNEVSPSSCSLGPAQLLGTGFDAPSFSPDCSRGGGTYWLTTAGNVIPGEIVELRIAVWDVGDDIFDSLALVDGFRWLYSATLPGTN